MDGGHQVYSGRAQQSSSPGFAAIEQHLTELEVILHRAEETASTREVRVAGYRALIRRAPKAVRRPLIGRGEAVNLIATDRKRCTGHSEGIEEAFFQEPVVGLPRHHLNDSTQGIESGERTV